MSSPSVAAAAVSTTTEMTASPAKMAATPGGAEASMANASAVIKS